MGYLFESEVYWGGGISVDLSQKGGATQKRLGTTALVGVLTRFREWPYAVTADIEGMFNQVNVAPADRAYLRFLWRLVSHLQQGHVHHEIVRQRHLRAHRRRGFPPGPLQPPLNHHEPGDPDRRPSASPW